MARSYAKLYGAIWRDPDWRALDAHAQRLYLLIVSQPEITNCGVVPYVPVRWSRMAADTPLELLFALAEELERHRFIVVDDTTSEVLVRSFVKHDKVAEQPKLVPAALRQYDEIQSSVIRTTLANSYPDLFQLRPEETPAKKATDSHPEAYGEAYAEGYREPYARARGRQPLTLDGKPPPADRGTGEAYAANTAAAAERLRTAGWTDRQIAEATAGQLDLALAHLDAAQADPTSTKPGALAWQRYQRHDPVPEQRPKIAPGATGPRSTQAKSDHVCPHCALALAGPGALTDHIALIHDPPEPAPPPAAPNGDDPEPAVTPRPRTAA